MEAFSISNEILPAGSPLIALFCLVPLYTAIYKAKSYKEAFGLMTLQTLVVHLLSSFWLANFHGFAVFTLGASAFGTCLMGGLCGVVMYIFPSLQKNSHFSYNELEETGGRKIHAPVMRMIWFASSFLFWEWIKSSGFLAYPWGTLSMAAYKWKLITQLSSFTGVWGISFLFAFFSAFIGESQFFCEKLLKSPVPLKLFYVWKNEALGLLAIFCITALYGVYGYFLPRTPQKYINTILVQQNADPWAISESESINISKELTRTGIKKFTDNNEKPELVLWSEGVLLHSFPQSVRFYENNPPDESLTEFVKNINVPLITGGSVKLNSVKKHTANAAILFDRTGTYSGFYSKMHLVPFAERLPYADNPLVRAAIKSISGVSSGWTPGNQYVLFKVPLSSSKFQETPLEYRYKAYEEITLDKNGISDPKKTKSFFSGEGENPDTTVSFTVPICFEDAFPDVCSNLYRAGSEVFMNITNDSWSATKSAEYQHFIAASYLAIEYRTTLVRCANSGYSVVVEPSGKIIADLKPFEKDVLSVKVPVFKRSPTVYSRYGDWFMYLCFAFMALVVLYFFREIFGERLNGKIKFIKIIAGYDTDESLDSYEEDNVPAENDDLITDKAPADKKKAASTKDKAASRQKKTASAQKKSPSAKSKTVSAKKPVSSRQKKTPVQKKVQDRKTVTSSRKVTQSSRQLKTTAKNKTVKSAKQKAKK